MRAPTLPLEGRCRCGAIRIRLTALPIMTSVCHCTGCQAMSSSAFSLTAMVPTGGFEVTAGEPEVCGLHNPAQRHMGCAHCMSWLYTEIEGAPFVNVRATMFDETHWFTPFLETMTRDKLPWVSIPAVRSYEGFPPMEEFGALLEAYGAASS